MIDCRLAMQERVLSELQHRDKRPLHHPATWARPETEMLALNLPGFDVIGVAG